MGLISHGTNQAFQYIDLLQWPHDGNLVINCILRGLSKISKVSVSKIFLPVSGLAQVVLLERKKAQEKRQKCLSPLSFLQDDLGKSILRLENGFLNNCVL